MTRPELNRAPVPARHPYQLWAMVAFVLSGAGLLASGPTTNSLALYLPAWARVAWALALLVGAALTLAGAYWRDAVTGLILERAGQAGLSGAALGYGAALLVAATVAGPAGFSRAVTATFLTLGIGVAAAQRTRQISRTLRRLELLRPGPGSDLTP